MANVVSGWPVLPKPGSTEHPDPVSSGPKRQIRNLRRGVVQLGGGQWAPAGDGPAVAARYQHLAIEQQRGRVSLAPPDGGTDRSGRPPAPPTTSYPMGSMR